MSDNVKQVGGDHYGVACGIGHWDLCEQYDVPYLEGNATKYIARYLRKGTPLLDLEKALSYVEKRIFSSKFNLYPAGTTAKDLGWRVVPVSVLTAWTQFNDFPDEQTILIHLLLCPRSIQDWHTARVGLQKMISRIKEQQ